MNIVLNLLLLYKIDCTRHNIQTSLMILRSFVIPLDKVDCTRHNIQTSLMILRSFVIPLNNINLQNQGLTTKKYEKI